ncbi:MAG: alkaline phosphatase family protein, partial [Aeromicrobium sp.]
ENHSFDQMRSGMPYTYALATEFGHATDFTAIRHPSLPNYIAMASGSTQGITDDKEPSGHKLSGPSVFGQAIAAGRTAGAYADGMTTNCATTGGGDRYAPRHNPWTYFADEREDCLKYDLPFTEFDQDVVDGDLPDIAFAIPNNCNNAHDEDCPLEVADEWFRVQMDKVFAGPDWQSGKLAVVLTADEDDRESDNKVLTVVIHPSQKGNVVTNPLTHYSLSRLFSEITHTTPLANAQTAPSMAEAFGLPIA